MARGRKRSENKVEEKMIQTLSDLERYEQWQREVLPKLQALVQSGAPADEILKFAEAYAAARIATEAMIGKNLHAAKDVLDRVQGKAKERTEVEHKYSKLTDEELDALLESRRTEISGDQDEGAVPTKKH